MNSLRATLLLVLLLLLSPLLSGQGAVVDGSWQTLDLGLLRAREATDNAPRPKDLPVQRVERDGIPFLYAGSSGPWRLVANGQRIALTPHEGGRFYELALAGRCELPADSMLEWELVGAGDKRSVLRARLLPAGSGQFRLALAANFPLQALRLPKNPALEVHALSLRWVAEGPNNATLARLFTEQSRSDRDTARWLKQSQPGGLLANAAGEAEARRAIFDAMLAGDEAAVRARLAERLALLEALNAARKQDRVRLCLTLPPERSGDLEALELLAQALRKLPELRAVIGGSAGWQLLAERRPRMHQALVASALEGRLELAGWQPQLNWPVLPDAVRYRSEFEAGKAWVEAVNIAGSAHPALLGDPVAQPMFVELALSAGRSHALLWAGDAAPRELTLGDSPERSIRCVTIPSVRPTLDENDALALLARMAAECGVRDALLPVALPADLARIEALLRRSQELTEALEGPSYLWSTPSAALAALRENPGFQPKPAATAVAYTPMTLTSYAERAAAERLPIVREAAWRASSFASFDGLRILSRLLDDPNATREALEKQQREALLVLARAAETKGSGQALLVFNLLARERSGVVECAMSAGTRLLDASGKSVPTAPAGAGMRRFRASVPPLGHALYRIVEGTEPQAAPAVREQDGRWMGSRLALAVDAVSGDLTSLRVLPEGIELLGGASNRLIGMEGSVRTTLEVRENSAVRWVLAITREASNATVEQELVLEADAPQLQLHTAVTRLVKGAAPRVAFVWREGSDRARVELAGGEALVPLADRQASGWLAARRYVGGVHDALGLGLVRVAQGRIALLPSEVRLELNDKVGVETLVLMPYLEPAGAVRLALAAEDLSSPLVALATDNHDGVRPGTLSFLKHGRLWPGGAYATGERSGVALERVRAGTAPGVLELLFRERLGEGGELEIGTEQRIFGVERLEAATGEWKPLRYERGRARLPLLPMASVQLRLRLRP